MAKVQELKDIMIAVESSALFRAALGEMLDKASAAAGVVLTPAERRRYRLSVSTIEADPDDGGAYQFYNICASKGCKTVKGAKKPKKLLEA